MIGFQYLREVLKRWEALISQGPTQKEEISRVARFIIFTLMVVFTITPVFAQNTGTPGASTGGSNAGCYFAWYTEYTQEGVHHDGPAGLNQSVRVDVFDAIVAQEGDILNLGAPNQPFDGSRFWCNADRNRYRYQTADYALPHLRAEVFSNGNATTELTAALSVGGQKVISWLADENQGCINTCRYTGTAKPRFVVNVDGKASTNGSLNARIEVGITERFMQCSGANNQALARLDIDKLGWILRLQGSGGISIGVPGLNLSGGATGITYPSQPSQSVSMLPKRWVYERQRTEDTKRVTADRLTAIGGIQSQLSVTSWGEEANFSIIHGHVYNADHGASLSWTATPSGTPTATPVLWPTFLKRTYGSPSPDTLGGTTGGGQGGTTGGSNSGGLVVSPPLVPRPGGELGGPKLPHDHISVSGVERGPGGVGFPPLPPKKPEEEGDPPVRRPYPLDPEAEEPRLTPTGKNNTMR